MPFSRFIFPIRSIARTYRAGDNKNRAKLWRRALPQVVASQTSGAVLIGEAERKARIHVVELFDGGKIGAACRPRSAEFRLLVASVGAQRCSVRERYLPVARILARSVSGGDERAAIRSQVVAGDAHKCDRAAFGIAGACSVVLARAECALVLIANSTDATTCRGGLVAFLGAIGADIVWDDDWTVLRAKRATKVPRTIRAPSVGAIYRARPAFSALSSAAFRVTHEDDLAPAAKRKKN